MDARIVVIGSGNVAGAMCEWIRGGECRVVQLFARNEEEGARIAKQAGIPFESDPDKIAKADMYIIAVSDKAIGEVSEIINDEDAVVVHTSGNCPPTEISPKVKNRGVLYPLQTFTKGRKPDYGTIPLFIEAENEAALAKIKELALTMSEKVYDSDTESRRKLHIAAVFVSNFVNHMYKLGFDFVKSNGMDPGILAPLIKETANKMLDVNNPDITQTGPAIREDYPTIEKHTVAIGADEHLRKIYKTLTESIIKTKNNG